MFAPVLQRRCNEALFYMSEATKRTAEWWSDPQREAPETQWVRVPRVLENMNLRATGDPAIDWINHSAGLWPALQSLLGRCRLVAASESLNGRCAGAISVSLFTAAMLPNAIESARKTAQAEGLDGIT